MTENQLEEFWDTTISDTKIKSTITKRKKKFLYESIKKSDFEKYESKGWEFNREYKTKIKVQKLKSSNTIFQDEVWTTIASLGFEFLNLENTIQIPYFNTDKSSPEFDVFAADSETILFVKCISKEGKIIKSDFLDEIEAIGNAKEDIHKSVRKLFPDSKHKLKFILSTKNYVISDSDKELLNNFQILHFDEETVSYYQELTKHLGLSTRYQLLGNLFEGQDIPELQNTIPAIEGKMGGHTYYSFSIEPEKLLKVGYVLHRNKANKKFMPTYQRLIKKARLKSVQQFVEDKGFFPNSIIINISNNGKSLKFEKSSTQVNDALSKIGVLHLPKKYRSSFIIDGQHRLYGYADSQYKDTNSIPVVAFVDLPRKDQVQLFMQINENQKAVPKNLRNTLNSDLLWNAENLIDRIKALKLQIAQDLGEEKTSPLYERIIVGENPKTAKCCITIDTIKIGLDRSNFFGSAIKNEMKSEGTFYEKNIDKTYDLFFPFIQNCFQYIKDNIENEWDKGEDSHNSYLTINAGIESLIRIFNDIVDYLISNDEISPKTESTDTLLKKVTKYLDPLIEHFKSLEEEDKILLRKSYGTGGRARYWRTLQKVIHVAIPKFNPDGMEKYWKDEAHTYNDKSFTIIRDIETHFKKHFKEELKSNYGSNWMKIGIPKSVYESMHKLASEKNYEITNNDEEVKPWDCLNIIDYRKIAEHKANWTDIFKKYYMRSGEEKLKKVDQTKWFEKLSRIRNENFHSYSVKEDEYQLLCDLNEWLIEK